MPLRSIKNFTGQAIVSFLAAKWLLIASIFFVSLVGFAALKNNWGEWQTGYTRLHTFELRFPYDAKIVRLLAAPGASVKKNDAIAILNPLDMDVRENLKDLAELEALEEAALKLKRKSSEGYVRSTELEKIETELALARGIQRLQEKIKVLFTQAHDSKTAPTDALLAPFIFHSPAGGVINHVALKEGSFGVKGDLLAKLELQEGPCQVEIYINESQVANILLSQTASVKTKFRRMSRQTYAGHVTFLSLMIEELPARYESSWLSKSWGRRVVVELDENVPLLGGEAVLVQFSK